VFGGAVVISNEDQNAAAPTVVIVDDQELIRRGLAEAARQHGLVVIGEAGSGEEAIETVVDLRPDVVLMDLELGDLSGVEATSRLAMLAPASRILVLTGTEDEYGVVDAIVAGASGYILKSAGAEAITAAVRATAAGETVISSAVAGQLLERIRERDIPVAADSRAAAAAIRAVLTERELEIFQYLASGETNQAIATALDLSPNTVSNHIASILAKLQLDNRIQAAVQAVRSGIS
jgi:DNA-binding NarL/FixJ family response regulator